MQSEIPTEPTRVAAGTYQRTVCLGQSDPELKKYLWVVIRTQKDRKLQTLIEVCTDFASLGQPTNVGAGIRDGGGRGPGGHGRHDGATAVDRSWYLGTADVPIPTTDVSTGSQNGLCDASNRTPFRHCSSNTKLP